MMGAAESISDLRSLLSIVAEETGALKMNDADEDSVGWTTEGPLPMTFGHVRRAHSALAAIEAALSAAEPVDYQLVFSDGRTSRVLYSKDEAERFKKASDITVDIRALYAAPPAPSVAVKALDWNASDSWNISKTIIGTYVVRPCLATNFLGQWLLRRAQSEGSDKTLYASEDEAKAVAQGDYEARIHSVLSAQVQDVATHRHKKRGSEYVLIGVGKMQAEDWFDWPDKTVAMEAVDMREVAIYRSVDDGSLWVRPVEEFNDGRFETLPAAPAKQEGGE